MSSGTRSRSENRENRQLESDNNRSTKQTYNRKRGRQPEFDANRSIVHTKSKQRKIKQPKMAQNTGNPDIGPQFIDLARTIMQGNQNTNNTIPPVNPGFQFPPPNTGAHDEEITPAVRGLVVDEVVVVQRSLEEKVKKMVQDEMGEVRRTIERLTSVVQGLAATNDQQNVTHNAQNNNDNNRGCNVNNSNINNNGQNANRSESLPNGSSTAPDITFGGLVAHNFNLMNQNGTTPSSSSQGGNLLLPERSQTFDLKRIRVDKLGIVFDERAMCIEDFIFRLEHVQAHYNIPWNEVVRDFHLLVSGSAKDWFWLFVETHGLPQWPTLRLALLNRYQKARSNFEVLRDLVERKQQVNETIDSYFHVMNRLRSRLVQPIPEFDMIKIMKRNVKESVGRIVYPIAVSSVEQLRIECNEAERNFPRKDFRAMAPPPRPTRQVSEVYFEQNDSQYDQETPDEDIEEIAALRFGQQQQQKPPVKCWNCQASGHIFKDCPEDQRALFCYRCGKPNVAAPKCPVCVQKNQKSGVGSTGDSRQTENPALSKN